MPSYEQPKEGAAMTTEKGGKVAPAGLWEHPVSGQRAITQHDPLFGNAQSQGFLRLGFKFIREAKPEEVKSLPELAAQDRSVEADTLKGVNARLNQLEGLQETNKNLEDELREFRAEKAAREKTEADLSGDRAKESAVVQTNAREQGDTEVELTEEGDIETAEAPSSDKPLDECNETELRAIASAEGVELTEAHDTKKRIKEAIEAQRTSSQESENK